MSQQAASTLDIKRRPRGRRKALGSQEAKVQVYMYQGGTKSTVARTQQSTPKNAMMRRAGARRNVSEEAAWQESGATKLGANGRGTLMCHEFLTKASPKDGWGNHESPEGRGRKGGRERDRPTPGEVVPR